MCSERQWEEMLYNEFLSTSHGHEFRTTHKNFGIVINRELDIFYRDRYIKYGLNAMDYIVHNTCIAISMTSG
jgi:hypothetical protein